MKKIFAAAINCIDGRVQIPVIEWMKKNYSVDYVDLITEPGPNQALSDDKLVEQVERIKSAVGLSVEKHDTKVLAVVAHADCASNRSSDETQIQQLRSAVKAVEAWPFDLNVIGLWVDETFSVTQIDQHVP